MNIHSDSIRLMSFNILYDYGAGEAYSWQSRKEYVFSLLKFHAPDIFCLQEPLQNQVDDLAGCFSDYNHITADCGDGVSEGQHMTIFYLTSKFDLLDFSKFGLSGTPEKLGAVGWDAKNPRLALWAKLLKKNTNMAFCIINTHLDHKGENARQQSALLSGKMINEIAGNAPCLLCGDFNASMESKAYNNITECGFIDCAGISSAIQYNQPYSYHKFLLNKSDSELE
ncbi:MAG: endonuclease/exonuclease/phosphatase family protein [Defluviitaleaceae bacterium]|nr:endonuclease/exonuclease/phosphatase family protein [Defluviitaleaceae bacterium]